MAQNSFILGITGPTGAGKTTLSALLAEKAGFFWIDADAVAHETLENNLVLQEILADTFGKDILEEENHLNRKRLAKRAFQNPDATAKLNDITHPFILSQLEKQLHQAIAWGKERIALDVPLLFESGLQHCCDDTVAVLAPLALRMQRIIQRDHLTQTEAHRRIAAQPDDAFYRHHANHIIWSEGEIGQSDLNQLLNELALPSGIEECYDATKKTP